MTKNQQPQQTRPEPPADAFLTGRVYLCSKHPEAGWMTQRESWEHNDATHGTGR